MTSCFSSNSTKQVVDERINTDQRQQATISAPRQLPTNNNYTIEKPTILFNIGNLKVLSF
jgi:hypothetical protein